MKQNMIKNHIKLLPVFLFVVAIVFVNPVSAQNQDKLNYELNIGSRKFKCTTIPIYRDGYGLVGAICINVDHHYINEEVRRDEKKLNSFINSICKTDMILDENRKFRKN